MSTTLHITPGGGAADDSLLLCVSDLQHSAIYDNPHEMVDCVRAVADRITALAASAPVAPAPQPAASFTEGGVFRSLIEFLLHADDALAFLRCWNEGDFGTCRKEWPEAPPTLYPDVAPNAAPLQQGEYLPLPKRRRRFLCTKCGSEQCKDGTENKPHPPCNKCNYLGFAEDCDFNDEEMRAYVDADRAMRGVAQSAPVAEDADQPHGFIKPDNDSHVYFYEQDFYVLSNFSSFTLEWRSLRFDTSEAAYHYEKFVDGAGCCDEIAHRILMAPSAHEAFKIAEANKAHRRPDWDDIKVCIMRGILRAKVEQHEYVRRKLLATGDRTLVEDSWRDAVWGWGPNRDGQNLLGKLWMEVRAELRASQKDGV